MTDQFIPGQKIGDYEVLGVLGAGGMGKVYKVRNVISDRVEAMKIVLANLAGQKELADRFTREIKLLASLNHPNIAGLRTALSVNDELIMIMEYVDGVTLSSRLEQGPVPPADAINYTSQILDALNYAHGLNVIHRDIKPANMMLTSQGVVKLMDFGIARPTNESALTVTGTALGSLNYMSPEQVKGVPVDPRSDLYSLGVSLYEMVTGQLPFRGTSNYSLMSAHLEQAPAPPIVVRPGVPQALNDIILMALAKDPNARFQTAEAFRNALASVQPGAVSASATRAAVPMAPPPRQPVAPVAAVVPTPPPPAASSHRGLYMALGALIVVAVLFAAGFYLPRRAKTQAGASDSTTSTAATDSGTPAQTPEQLAAIVAAQQAADAAAAQREQAAAVASARQASADAAAAKERAAGLAQAEAERQAAIKRDAELAEAEKQDDQLEARAAAMSGTLENLRRAQAQQGVGLRGDMAAADQLLHTDLSRARSAIEAKDPENAKKYLNAAEIQAEQLEHFLGR